MTTNKKAFGFMPFALSSVLLKIFANGFYRVHAGMFLFGFLVIFGAVEPGQLFSYHKALMLAFISSPLMLLAVFAAWLLYSIKTWHYVAGQIFAVHHQFLFYSSTAFSKKDQLKAWCVVQATVLLPVIIYGLLAVVVGFGYGHYIMSLIVLIYLGLSVWGGAYIYVWLIGRQIDGGKSALLLRFGNKWPKPYFSLYVYQVFNGMKVRYLIVKAMSYLIVNGVFLLFADVSSDVRVAGIAVLAIATAHTAIIFEERRFEETFLSFSRGLPYKRLPLFGGFALTYLILLLPEAAWLYLRFSPLMATQMLALCLSVVLLFHSLLYWMGLNMDRYLPWVLGLFVVIFWVILFRQIGAAIILNSLIALWVFYQNYYRTFAVEPSK